MEYPERKICRLCAASNEADAVYCKRCGTPLGTRDKETPKKAAVLKRFEEADVSDAAIFVGRRADHYIPKFMDMEMRRSRASWNWPVLLFALLFGPAAMSVWFFYRKINKPAWLLLLAGLVILGINTAVSYDFNVQFFSLLIENIHALAVQQLSPPDFFQFLLNRATPAAANGSLSFVLNTMLSVLVFVCKLTAAVFANGIYKYHVAKCVKEAPAGENRAETLRVMGGVSVKRAVGVSVCVALAYLSAGATPVLGSLGIL